MPIDDGVCGRDMERAGSVMVCNRAPGHGGGCDPLPTVDDDPAGWPADRVRAAMLPWSHPDSQPTDTAALAEAGHVGAALFLLNEFGTVRPAAPEPGLEDWRTGEVVGQYLTSLWQEAADWFGAKVDRVLCRFGSHGRTCRGRADHSPLVGRWR